MDQLHEPAIYSHRQSAESLAKVAAMCLLLLSPPVAALMGLKFFLIVVGVAIFLSLTLVIPIEYSIAGFFGYLLFDGALKILSNYHPLIHVGQDLYLLTLVGRVGFSPERGLNKWPKTPFFGLIAAFLASVLVQFFNPFGLGLLPSIAGTKVYLAGILLFFLAYHNLNSLQIRRLIVFIVALGLAQSAIALTEYFMFPEEIFRLHPKYRQIAADKFIGELYRPFGTTAAPGAPSLWVFLCAPFALHLITEGRIRERLLGVTFLAGGLVTLIVCQTRAAMVLFILMSVCALLAPNRRWLPKLLLLGAALIAIGAWLDPQGAASGISTALTRTELAPEKREAIVARFSTLLDRSTYRESRRGAFNQMWELGKTMPWGIGLSRVGAASAVWKDRIEADEHFGKRFAFADSVYRSVFTELGIVGLCAWLLVVVSISSHIVRKSFYSAGKRRRSLLWICGCVPMVILCAGIGSEGILYMPVGGFLWLSMAIGLKESRNV